ncbi:hypothetical protein PNBC_07495 [Paenibacillus crassostreae]|uniref:Uncharacterized protein n=1 Tax=Paenibacillus crassostreae TaxID=1763538 RepID=A0A167ETP4_9BACL|nr:hypothetical protein LPB68_15525 [Paenibacillus crassostreae]OAB75869.1 hypothetical protein PNBC_07495 [Paenibacillus crassostreae]
MSILYMRYIFLERPVKREIINNTIKIKKSIFAIEAAAATILKNPKIPAINAIINNITDHLSMILTFLSVYLGYFLRFLHKD